MKEVTLNEPYLGYTSGVTTGRVSDYKYEIRLPSGLTIWLYPGEFTYNS